jgi:uncharacterized membrane protein YcaP (DUF421 family)
VTLLSIVGRSLVVYAVILIGFRLGGRREIGQLTTFDIILVLLVANAVQNAMVGGDTTLQGGLVSAATLFGFDRIVGFFRLRYPAVDRIVAGNRAEVVMHDGRFTPGAPRRFGLTQEDVIRAVREHGEDDLGRVRNVWLEADGSISTVMWGDGVQQRTTKQPIRPTRRLRRRRSQ